MDVISWAAGLIAGISQPSLRRAVAIGVAVSIALRVYQYFFTDPRVWGHTFPQDLFGAAAMLALTAVVAWIGWIIRQKRRDRAEVVS